MTTPYQEVSQVIAVKAQSSVDPVVETFVLTEVAVNGKQITAVAAVTPGDTKSNDLVRDFGAATYTLRQVADHKSADDLWIIVDEDIYDVTRFQHEHPGGHKGECFPCLCVSEQEQVWLTILNHSHGWRRR